MDDKVPDGLWFMSFSDLPAETAVRKVGRSVVRLSRCKDLPIIVDMVHNVQQCALAPDRVDQFIQLPRIEIIRTDKDLTEPIGHVTGGADQTGDAAAGRE